MSINKRWAGVSAGAAMSLTLLAGQAGAAGFALVEQSGGGQGNAFAGAAAIGEDASTIFFNPAAMTRLGQRQLVVGGHLVSPTADFTNKGSKDAIGGPLNGSDDDTNELGIVPNLYFMTTLDDKTKFGIGINAPFGLATEYDDNWVGRYHALKSEVRTLNINPSFAYKMTPGLSLGLGINAQYIEVDLSNAVDFATVCLGLGGGAGCGAPQSADGSAEVAGDDWSFGFNVGALYEFTKNTRLGMAYRSKVDHRLTGDVDFEVPAAIAGTVVTIPGLGAVPIGALFQDGGISSGTSLPENLSISVYHAFSDRFALMGDITRTRWSRFQELRIVFDSFLTPDSVTDESWKDSNRYSIGANFTLNPQWLLRGGLAYDETPIPDAEHRTARIPGNDRTWLSMGARFTPSTHIALDFGYSHLFIDDTEIRSTQGSPEGTLLKGSYESSVDILSGQLVYTF